MREKIEKFLEDMFLYLRNVLKFKPVVLGQVFNGIGAGLMSNTIFVFTTNQEVDSFRLVFSFLFAIVFIVLGNVKKGD